MAELFHPHGTYTDPFVGTIPTAVIPTMINRIHEVFPDFVFDLVGAVTEATVKGQRTIGLQWRMRGTEATSKRAIDLAGVDFLAFDGPLLCHVNTYFDMATLQRQSGLTDKDLVFNLV